MALSTLILGGPSATFLAKHFPISPLVWELQIDAINNRERIFALAAFDTLAFACRLVPDEYRKGATPQ